MAPNGTASRCRTHEAARSARLRSGGDMGGVVALVGWTRVLSDALFLEFLPEVLNEVDLDDRLIKPVGEQVHRRGL